MKTECIKSTHSNRTQKSFRAVLLGQSFAFELRMHRVFVLSLEAKIVCIFVVVLATVLISKRSRIPEWTWTWSPPPALATANVTTVINGVSYVIKKHCLMILVCNLILDLHAYNHVHVDSRAIANATSSINIASCSSHAYDGDADNQI